MVKAVGPARPLQPALPGGGQQSVGAHQVGAYESVGAADRAVDMALGGKVHDGVNIMLGQGLADLLAVADIPLDEHQLRLVFQGRQGRPVAGIGQDIVGHQGGPGVLSGPVIDEIGANKAGSAGDHECTCHV